MRTDGPSSLDGPKDKCYFRICLGVRKLDKPDWTPMMEQALNVIYFLAEHPETIAESIIKKIAACLLDKSENSVDAEEETTSEKGENGNN